MYHRFSTIVVVPSTYLWLGDFAYSLHISLAQNQYSSSCIKHYKGDDTQFYPITGYAALFALLNYDQ